MCARVYTYRKLERVYVSREWILRLRACVCVCVQFIVKQLRRLTAPVDFAAATFVVVITIVCELHAQHSSSAAIAVIHYTFVNDNGYCCCRRSNTFTERKREMHIFSLAFTFCISCRCSRTLNRPSFCPAACEKLPNSNITHFLNYHSRAKQLHELILSFSLFLPYLLSR